VAAVSTRIDLEEVQPSASPVVTDQALIEHLECKYVSLSLSLSLSLSCV